MKIEKLNLIEYVNLMNRYEEQLKQGITMIFTIEDKNLMAYMRQLAKRDKEISTFLQHLSDVPSYERLEEIEKYYNEKEKIENAASEEEKEIAKTFGIDISKINHKYLNNNKEIFYFYDLKLGKEVVLENKKEGKSLVEQLKEMQLEKETYQTTNNETNTYRMLNNQRNNMELDLLTINEIKNHQQQLSNMNKEDYNKLNYLINNYNNLNIKYINLENLFYIDENNILKEVIYDKNLDRYIIEEPASAYNKEENIDTNDTISENYNSLQSDYENKPNIELEKNIEIESYDELPQQIKDKVKIYYEYPELLEKLDKDKQEIWKHYIDLYQEKLDQEQELTNNKPKVKVKQEKVEEKKAGFISAFLLFILTGFTGGILATILTLILSK